jgi:CrcB protein
VGVDASYRPGTPAVDASTGSTTGGSTAVVSCWSMRTTVVGEPSTAKPQLETPPPVGRPSRRAARGARRQLELAIFVGGAIGALARAGLEEALPAADSGWPWATLVVNVVGTFLLGFFVTRLQERLPPSTYRRPFLGTGLCGALTTFSTLQIELIELVRDDRAVVAGLYLLSSLAAGLGAVYVATAAVRKVGGK